MHIFPVQIYYEDTDHSGRVYHANYLKYFERAREGAVFGDALEIRSRMRIDSEYRVTFRQDVWRPGAATPMVEGTVQMVCVDAQQKLIRIPEKVRLLSCGAPGF